MDAKTDANLITVRTEPCGERWDGSQTSQAHIF
jgi:hypothetical protein